jgi:hypothetical protein
MLCTPCRHVWRNGQGKVGSGREECSPVKEDEEAQRPPPRLVAGYIAENTFARLCVAAI